MCPLCVVTSHAKSHLVYLDVTRRPCQHILNDTSRIHYFYGPSDLPPSFYSLKWPVRQDYQTEERTEEPKIFDLRTSSYS